ncbi:thioredoxin-like domain-containing protein [Sphingobacterium tabacisoli]|uniref:Thioredoxin-like domain-containing protein n=1 Tax=Sphingobacterium tabacisoli TaxID=2044855 RepID=A0ABW5LA09_9SPHI|nr:thioredoxin-like domain-containing protein [Sphingobacterium tabacisoli]
MRNTLFTIMLSSLVSMGMAQQSFLLKGQIAGKAANGQIVKLLADNGQTTIGTAVIKNNRFQIKGSIGEAERIKIIFAPDKKAEENKWKASNFYLDGGQISLSGHIDSIPSYYYRPDLPAVNPIIEGSQAQNLAYQLERSIAADRKVTGQLNEDYLKEYHVPTLEGKFNTEKGITILKEMTPYNERIFQKKWAFIKNNPNAKVSLDNALYMLEGYGEKDLSKSQMDELVDILTPYWKDKTVYTEFLKTVSQAKATAIGSKILDGPILDREGNRVQLTSVFPKGKKYILLEFWASWCGPCRGEIPHLVHTMSHWKDKGFDIISISLDEKESDWKKAMKEENMDWHQYNAREGFKSQIAQSYNIQGIPYALLIDSAGRIIKHGMRGANLDMALEELMK